MSALWESRRRVLRFAMVGAFCFGLQYAVLLVLKWAGVPAPVANGVGFVASAQVNFALSSAFTWGDRDLAAGRAWRWLSYNGTVLVSLAVNTIVFALVHTVTGDLAAAALGVAVGTLVTYLLGDLIVFRARVDEPERVEDPAPAGGGR